MTVVYTIHGIHFVPDERTKFKGNGSTTKNISEAVK